MSRLFCMPLGIGVLFLALSAGAQTWDRGQYGQPRYEPYYPERGYGYGQGEDYLIGRVMFDLIGIGAAVTHRPLPYHRAYGSVHGGASRLR
jgi:hypothetical protein